MKKESSSFTFSEILLFLKSRIFLYNLIRLFLVIIILWIINSIFLRIYTNHGEKLVLPKYEGIPMSKVIENAEGKGYQIIVSDSVFIKGKEGGIVLSQIPVAGSKVKSGRSVYVTITKYESESFSSETLPLLYGKKLEFKKNELYNTFELISKIRGTKYDPGPENHILEVYYKGELIVSPNIRKIDVILFKGDTLEFILSKRSGGEVPVPSLVCKTLAAGKFLLSSSYLEIGSIEEEGTITDPESAYIIDQIPAFEPDKKLAVGSRIAIRITQERPYKCN
jgi:eukaryotic-like serine/threonine-protein kinase